MSKKNVLYTLEDFITDAANYNLSQSALGEIYSTVNQTSILSDISNQYTFELFGKGKEFLTQKPEIIIDSFHYTDEHTLFAVKKGATIYCRMFLGKVDPKKIIDEDARNEALQQIKSILFDKVNKNVTVDLERIKKETYEAAQEALMIELLERGVL